jgi:hypothetical protein
MYLGDDAICPLQAWSLSCDRLKWAVSIAQQPTLLLGISDKQAAYIDFKIYVRTTLERMRMVR